MSEYSKKGKLIWNKISLVLAFTFIIVIFGSIFYFAPILGFVFFGMIGLFGSMTRIITYFIEER